MRGRVVTTRSRAERGDEDLMRLYLDEIGQFPLLTKEDEARLAQAIETRDHATRDLQSKTAPLSPAQVRSLRRAVALGDDAKRIFIQSNLRLVVHIARKYQSSGLPLLDLIQEGNLGLIHAVDKFDWRKGFKFSTYATWWIRQAVTRGIANSARTIRLPIQATDLIKSLQSAQSELEARLGRAASTAELAVEMDLPAERIQLIRRFRPHPRSLSEPLRDDGDAELGDVIEDRLAASPFDEAKRSLLPDEVVRVLAPLDERERVVLRLRFGLDRGEPRTLQEVAEHFDLTREGVRQIEARALSKLRHPSNDCDI